MSSAGRKLHGQHPCNLKEVFSFLWTKSGPIQDSETVRLPHEPRLVFGIRIFAFIVVAAVAGCVGGLAYQSLKAAENSRFHAELDFVTRSLDLRVKAQLADLRAAAEDFSSELSIAPGGQSLILGLQEVSASKLRLGKAVSGAIVAAVPVEDRLEFEEWASDSATAVFADHDAEADDTAIGSSHDPPAALKLARDRYRGGILAVVGTASAGPVGAIPPVVAFPPADASFLPDSGVSGVPKMFFPVIQAFPIDTMAKCVMVDMQNITGRNELIRHVISTGQSGSAGLLMMVSDIQQNKSRPMTAFASPISYRDAVTRQRTITGALELHILWESVLAIPLADKTSVEIVLHSPSLNFYAGQAGLAHRTDASRFTFRIEGSAVTPMGWGDVHNPNTHSGSASRKVALSLGLASFDLTVYPTGEMHSAFMSALPAQAVVACLLITCGIAAFFSAFSIISRRQYNAVYIQNAAQNAEMAAEKESMRSRHAFVSMVSHEIRSPASAIVGALDVLHSTNLDRPQRDYLARSSLTPGSNLTAEVIRDGSAQILNLVEDALNVGFTGTGQFSLSPNDILERAWNTIRLQKCFAEKAKTIEMVCRIKKDVPERAIADAPRIVQVLTNLISNAIKFVPEGHGSVKMTAGFSDEMLTVSVSDNGRGISEDGLSRLFRPFSQAEGEETKKVYGGTGLGLVICRDIVRAMGGDLTVTSPGLGQGSTFVATMQLLQLSGDVGGAQPYYHDTSVHLGWYNGAEAAPPAGDLAPAAAGAAADGRRRGTLNTMRSAGASSGAGAEGSNTGARSGHASGIPLGTRSLASRTLESPSLRGFASMLREEAPVDYSRLLSKAVPIRVLAAEDDALCRRVLNMTLKLASMDCTTVQDGVELTKILTAQPTSADLILLDSNMGGGDCDGLPTIRRIIALFESHGRISPPIIVLSGEGDPQAVHAFLEAGATQVLRKPASLDALKKLAQLVHGAGPDRARTTHVSVAIAETA